MGLRSRGASRKNLLSAGNMYGEGPILGREKEKEKIRGLFFFRGGMSTAWPRGKKGIREGASSRAS